MFTTVIWASDGSENAARALPYARALLAGDDAMLIAVHIALEAPSHRRDADTRSGAAASEHLESVRALAGELSDQGLKVAVKIANYASPQPAQAIADVAREVGADVIVLGTRGHSRLAGALVGSVTQSLLHIAPCPVLAVPPPITEAQDATDTGLRVTAG